MNHAAYFLDAFPVLSQTFIRDEIAALQRKGWQVAVMARWRPAAVDLATEELHGEQRVLYGVDYIQEGGWRFWRLHARWFIRQPWRYLTTAWFAWMRKKDQLGRRFRECVFFAEAVRKAEVEHLHAHFVDWGCDLAMLVSRLTGLPMSFTTHASELYVKPRLLLEKVRHAAFVATISEASRTYLSSVLADQGLSRKIQIVRCGLDFSQWTKVEPPKENGPLAILGVGRLVPKKGFHVLLEACACLRDKGIPFSCTILGEGPERSSLEARIASHQLQDVVRLVGAQPREQVRRVIEQCNLFVLPCVIAEDGNRDGIPVALMEAVATGRPVISTRVTGIPELIKDGAGRLVAPGDPDGLAGAIESLSRMTPAEWASMGQAGRAIVEASFNLDREAEKLAALFRNGLRVV